MKILRFFLALAAHYPGVADAQDAQPAAELPPVIETTPGGVEYGIWGASDEKPAPVLFVLANTIEGTLSSKYFRQCGNEMAANGYLLVSIDIPCHGKQNAGGKLSGLGGWAERAKTGDDFVAESNQRLSAVLDHLIKAGVADIDRVAVCGTSRGGFLAVHFAAHDARVKSVAAFAPVTDLTKVTEFAAVVDNPLIKKLSMENLADKLAGRAVWIVIGDQDGRVSTQSAIDVAQAITAASIAKKVDSKVDLHVIAEPGGHRTPPGSADLAAGWMLRVMAE